MAIYVLQIKMVSRSEGRSAPAAAAYRAGASITNERTEIVYDYIRKGGVESAEIFLPKGAPEWAADRSELWNAVERSETRKNSQVAREFIVALPAELSPSERKRLVHDFAKELVERHGVAADVTIHAPGRGGDSRNHHAHILLTTRRLGKEGFGEKTREFQKGVGSVLVTEWRQRWQDLQNERLAENGSDARVDCRTNEAQGKGEPDIHYGHEVIGLERRTGEKSQVRLAREAEVAERQQADQVIDNEIAVERDGVAELKAMLEAAEQERVDQERLALSGSTGDDEVLKWWADRVDERAVEIRNEDRAADDDDRQGLVVEVQAGADDAAVKKAEASLTADCPELAARVIQAQDRQRVREHQKKNLERRERVKKIKEKDRLFASGPEGDAEVVKWWTDQEPAAVGERIDKARTEREPVERKLDKNGRSLQAKDREKPEQPRGWFAFFKQGGYKRELATWETERSEIVAEGRALEKKRDKLLRIERNVGGYTERLVRKDFAADDPLMASRLEKAERRVAGREKHNDRDRGRGKGRGHDQGKSQAAQAGVEKWRQIAIDQALLNKQEQEAREAVQGVTAAKRPESEAAKTVREYEQERGARLTKRMDKYTKEGKAERVELDKDKAERKAHKAQEPEPRKGVFAWTKRAEFEREYSAWQKVDQALEKRIREREKKLDRLEKLGRNHGGATVREVMAEMEKANPGRAKQVEAAREIVVVEVAAAAKERRDEIVQKFKEQGQGRGQGQGIEYDPFD